MASAMPAESFEVQQSKWFLLIIKTENRPSKNTVRAIFLLGRSVYDRGSTGLLAVGKFLDKNFPTASSLCDRLGVLMNTNFEVLMFGRHHILCLYILTLGREMVNSIIEGLLLKLGI